MILHIPSVTSLVSQSSLRVCFVILPPLNSGEGKTEGIIEHTLFMAMCRWTIIIMNDYVNVVSLYDITLLASCIDCS